MGDSPVIHITGDTGGRNEYGPNSSSGGDSPSATLEGLGTIVDTQTSGNSRRKVKRRPFRSQSHNPENKNFQGDNRISYDIHKRIQQEVGAHLFTSNDLATKLSEVEHREKNKNEIIDINNHKLRELEVNQAIHAVIHSFMEGNPSCSYSKMISKRKASSPACMGMGCKTEQLKPQKNLVNTTINLVEECLRFALTHDVFDGIYVSRLRKNNEFLKRSNMNVQMGEENDNVFRKSLDRVLSEIESQRRETSRPVGRKGSKAKNKRGRRNWDDPVSGNDTVEHIITDLVNNEFNGEKIDSFLMAYRFFTTSHLLLKNLKLAFEATEMPFFDSEEENLRVQLNILSVLIRWTCRDEYSLDPEVFNETQILEEILQFAKAKASRKKFDAVVHLSLLQVLAHVNGTVECITEGESSDDAEKDGSSGGKIQVPETFPKERSGSAISIRLGGEELDTVTRSYAVNVDIVVNPLDIGNKDKFLHYHHSSEALSGITGLNEVAKKFDGMEVKGENDKRLLDMPSKKLEQSLLCTDRMEITNRTTALELKNAVCSLHGLEPDMYDVRVNVFGALVKDDVPVSNLIFGKSCSSRKGERSQLGVWPTALDWGKLKYARSSEALAGYCDEVDHSKLMYLDGAVGDFGIPITSHASASCSDIFEASLGIDECDGPDDNGPNRRNSIFSREVMCLSSGLMPQSEGVNSLSDIMDPKVIAYCLTLSDFRDFQKITPQYLAYPKEAMSKKAGYIYIQRIEQRFEKVVKWLTSLVLDNLKTEDRLKAIEKLIMVGEECFKLRNFHGCIEVITTLTSAPIKRLQDTWYHIDPKYSTIVEKLEGLILPNNNRLRYRSALRNLRKPCLPYLGVYMSDLLFIDSGNPSVIRDPASGLDCINVVKFEKLSKIFREIRSFQSSPYVGLTEFVCKRFVDTNFCEYESPVSRLERHMEREAMVYMGFLDDIHCLDSDGAYSKSVHLEPLQRRAIHHRKRIIRSTRTYTF
eukprot:Nk52_evm27s279 gene=Nk52_evmTU27s279